MHANNLSPGKMGDKMILEADWPVGLLKSVNSSVSGKFCLER